MDQAITFHSDRATRSHIGTNRVDNFEQKSHAIGNFPAVFVAPLVEQWR